MWAVQEVSGGLAQQSLNAMMLCVSKGKYGESPSPQDSSKAGAGKEWVWWQGVALGDPKYNPD